MATPDELIFFPNVFFKYKPASLLERTEMPLADFFKAVIAAELMMADQKDPFLKPNERYAVKLRGALKATGEIVKQRRKNADLDVYDSLRKYQSEAIDSVFKDFSTNDSKKFMHIAHSFGAGKTRIACGIIKAIHDPKNRPAYLNGKGKTLVVVPPAIESDWKKELELWGIPYVSEGDYWLPDDFGEMYAYPERLYILYREFWNLSPDEPPRTNDCFVNRHADVVLMKADKFDEYMKLHQENVGKPIHKGTGLDVFDKLYSTLIWDDFDTSKCKIKDDIKDFINVVGLSATFDKPDDVNGAGRAYTKYNSDDVNVEPTTALYKTELMFRITERIASTFKNTRFQDLFKEGNYAESLVELGISSVNSIADLINFVTRELLDEIARNPEKKEENTAKIEYLKARAKENMESCSICSDTIKENPTSIEERGVMCGRCQICFHVPCITEWYSVSHGYPTCPFCKLDLVNESMVSFNPAPAAAAEAEAESSSSESEDDSPAAPEPTVYPNKTAAIVEAVKTIKEDFYDKGVTPRILIVNESNTNTDETILTKAMPNLKFGNIYTDPEKTLVGYRSGEINVINLNSWTDCAGLNIPETTHIIITAQVQKPAHEQIVRRGHRYGSTCDTHVYSIVKAPTEMGAGGA